MTLVGTDENIVIFRGTTSEQEWIDNGQGGYLEKTDIQDDALDYVNSIELVNSNSFVVSGHSKGGNLAQYVTLFATDTLIDRCLNFDGQGFSNELFDKPEYHRMYINISPEDNIFFYHKNVVPSQKLHSLAWHFFNLMIFSVILLYSGQIRK